VDRCVRAIARAGERADPYSVTHITNSGGPTIREAILSIFEVCELAPPTFVSQAGLLSDIDSKFSEKIDFYAPYIRQEKHFLQADDEIARISNVTIDRADLDRLFTRYVSTRAGHARPAYAAARS
jgi:hypothetical protein